MPKVLPVRPAAASGKLRNIAASSRRRSSGCLSRAPSSTTPARTSSRWPGPCWMANWSTARDTTRRRSPACDGLPYDEPWAWMQPARHAYGALLLEQDRVAEAEAVYRADLGLDGTLARACQHPGNVWSLHGYHECLRRLGKDEQAGIIGQQLTIARAYADVPIRSSCYCRLAPAPGPDGPGRVGGAVQAC